MDLYEELAKLIDPPPADDYSKALDDAIQSALEEQIKPSITPDMIKQWIPDPVVVGSSVPEQLEKLSQQVANYKSELADNNDQAHMDSVKERRHAWTIAVLGWIVSPLIALAIEHFSEIIEFFRSLF